MTRLIYFIIKLKEINNIKILLNKYAIHSILNGEHICICIKLKY